MRVGAAEVVSISFAAIKGLKFRLFPIIFFFCDNTCRKYIAQKLSRGFATVSTFRAGNYANVNSFNFESLTLSHCKQNVSVLCTTRIHRQYWRKL